MNWKENLIEDLTPRRKRNNSIEVYLSLKKEVIQPTLKEISAILNDHYIFTSLGTNNEELTVQSGFLKLFRMKILFQDSKLKLEYYCADNIELSLEPELILKSEKFFELSEVTEELIGKEFYENFKPLLPICFSEKQ